MSEILDTDITFWEGVGPKRAEALAKVGILTFRDLFYNFPRRYLDRSTVTPIRALQEGMGSTTIVGTITNQVLLKSGRDRFEVTIEDDSGAKMTAVWFQGINWIRRAFQNGDHVAFFGTPQKFGNKFSFSHPDFDKLDTDKAALATGRIIPLYHGTAGLQAVGLTSRTFRHLTYNMFVKHGLELGETLPKWIIDEYKLLEGRVALRAIHFPKDATELERAKQRLKFEEFFFLQLLLATTRQKVRKTANGMVFKKSGEYFRKFIEEALPFELTKAQQKTIKDIVRDTKSGYPMNRLVQGDVGSGKTVVAIAAMMHALDSGYQSAFMAPTEILAEQHYANLKKYLEPLGVNVHLLIGGQNKKRRKEILEDLITGNAQVAVGTHALITDNVQYHKLGMAIIDEQHRFGVMQRAAMFSKGERPHTLLMTATPIPRSLAMTVYGDLDVTVMNEMPKDRKPIKTIARSEKRRGEVYEFIREQLREGRQAYVVYPLVEESEKMDLKDAENGFEELTAEFRPYKVDMVHGRMFGYEKDEAMQRFKNKEVDILVATTVIEVGVDVPNATVMLIEHAERFGLSQLHQLRGRVGRGSAQSHCVLMTDYKQSEEAKIRIQAMCDTNDGFKISEIDLKLRGAGDFFGTKQSGLPDLKIADITKDAEILSLARNAAFDLVERDPHLRLPEHLETRQHFAKTAPPSLGMAQVG